MNIAVDDHCSLPGSLGWCATMASVWEVTAPKPGNVHRGVDFDDVTYGDFVKAAVAIGPAIDRAPQVGISKTVLAAVRLTRAAVGTNTNLGTLLLIAPLACVSESREKWRDAASQLVQATTTNDTSLVYEAIRTAMPGAMGKVERGDLCEAAPEITLIEAMRLAADRDMIARQYVNDFEQVWEAAKLIKEKYSAGTPLGAAIVYAHLSLMSRFPDSLIGRKCGVETAVESQERAAAVLRLHSQSMYEDAVGEFDAWLRAEGHKRNPGTTADLIAAGLFVQLVEKRLTCPVKFY